MEEPTARPRRLSDLRFRPLKVAFSQPETVGPGLANTGQGVKRIITASDDEGAHLSGSAHLLSGSASSLRAVPHATRFARRRGTRSSTAWRAASSPAASRRAPATSSSLPTCSTPRRTTPPNSARRSSRAHYAPPAARRCAAESCATGAVLLTNSQHLRRFGPARGAVSGLLGGIG